MRATTDLIDCVERQDGCSSAIGKNEFDAGAGAPLCSAIGQSLIHGVGAGDDDPIVVIESAFGPTGSRVYPVVDLGDPGILWYELDEVEPM